MNGALTAQDLVVVVGGRRVLDGVSLRVERGEFVALCGPNGGGKTTFLKAALGLVPAQSGRVEVFGGRPGGGKVGYLPQRKAFSSDFPATATELVVANLTGGWPFRISAGSRKAAEQALERVGASHLAERPLSRLSGGETQRVFLARALATEPELLLLDEPTAGVDAQGRAGFLDILEGLGRPGTMAVVLVTHNVATVRRLASRAFSLERRIVAEGTPDQVFPRETVETSSRRDHAEHGFGLCEEE